MSNTTPPKEIERIHKEILDEMNRSITTPQWLKRLTDWIDHHIEQLDKKMEQFIDFIKNIIDVIQKFPPVLKLGLALLILVAIVLLVWFLVRRIKVRNLKRKSLFTQKKENRKALPLNQFNEVFEKALQLGKEGEFEEAILTLHRGSVANLHKQNKLQHYRDYTNREITAQLESEKRPFQILARSAEKILFGYAKVTENDFIKMKDIYWENFYG